MTYQEVCMYCKKTFTLKREDEVFHENTHTFTNKSFICKECKIRIQKEAMHDTGIGSDAVNRIWNNEKLLK